MSKQVKITHFYHSGFSVEAEDVLFVFDYWRGEKHELQGKTELTPDELKKYRKVYVLISHEHIDHMDPIVFTWKNEADVSYFVSSDMPVGTRGKRMAPGDTVQLEEDVTLTAFDSTDLGVSFLLKWHGIHIFHAGDLNFWHWRDESTVKEIQEAEREFQKAVKPLEKENIDISFFPVDPRQGTMFEAGADYFILAVKPRLMIPMHYFHRSEIISEYARVASCRTTEVLAMPGIRDSIIITFDDQGYLNISFPGPTEDTAETSQVLESIEADNPFYESDLPLSQLAENPDNPDDPEHSSEDHFPFST
ncbi:MAG: MBL fold metallo-hydrolase [Clostridia bacterium]|nr:MBL fold metallo-hydrolase [Clostridia bacterium]